MVDNVVAMPDLSEDEGSPRHRMSEDTARDEMFQAYQAYQVGLDLVRRIRDAEERHADQNDGLPEQSDGAEGEDGRRSEWKRHPMSSCGCRYTMVTQRWNGTMKMVERKVKMEVPAVS